MKQIMFFAILAIVGASAQPLLFSREDSEPYKAQALDIEDAGDQPTVMQPETAAAPVALTFVVCPGGKYQCLDRTTCCRSGQKWSCCPYPQAVCCSDQKHCCPQGKTCDLSSGKCKGGDSQTDWMAKEPVSPLGLMTEQNTFLALEEASINTAESGEQLIQMVSMATSRQVKDVPCGGGHYCPDSHPVCCSDMIHCCPAGMTCVAGGLCIRSFFQLNWVVKERAIHAETAASVRQLEGADKPVKEPATTVGSIPCGGGYSCPDRHTCCKSGEKWKCCPHPKAVCCKDGKHCCRQGESCGPKSCNSIDIWAELVKKAPAKIEPTAQIVDEKPPIQQKIVPCPGGQYHCQDGQTCCPQPAGGYGCCTTLYPVCCPDGLHCCQQGTTCDPTSRWCNGGDQIFKAFRKIPARQIP